MHKIINLWSRYIYSFSRFLSLTLSFRSFPKTLCSIWMLSIKPQNEEYDVLLIAMRDLVIWKVPMRRSREDKSKETKKSCREQKDRWFTFIHPPFISILTGNPTSCDFSSFSHQMWFPHFSLYNLPTLFLSTLLSFCIPISFLILHCIIYYIELLHKLIQ